MPHCGHPFSDFLLDGSLQPIINQFAASGSRGNSHPLRRGLLSIGTGCARRAFLLDRRPQGSILPGDRRAAASPREGPQLAQGLLRALRKLRPEQRSVLRVDAPCCGWEHLLRALYRLRPLLRSSASAACVVDPPFRKRSRRLRNREAASIGIENSFMLSVRRATGTARRAASGRSPRGRRASRRVPRCSSGRR